MKEKNLRIVLRYFPYLLNGKPIHGYVPGQVNLKFLTCLEPLLIRFSATDAHIYLHFTSFALPQKFKVKR